MKREDGKRENLVAALKSAAMYFGIVFGAGFAFGLVRVPFLAPRLGERLAELVEMPLMLVVIYLAAGHVIRRQAPGSGRSRPLLVGMAALMYLVAAELLIAVVLAGRSVGDYISARDPVSGAVYIAMLCLFALMPWLRRTH
ncbi:MAG: hypothetical protein PVJ33_08225 [Lysobacterales bacterium]|jgi:hypothetical protein